MTNKPILTLTLLSLAACDSTPTGSSPGRSSANQQEISGLVLDDNGPITGDARIEVMDGEGRTVARVSPGSDAQYRVQIPAGVSYPLILSASINGEEAPLKAAVVNAEVTDQDISPVSTLVVETARNLGGLTEANLAKAARAAIAQRKKSGGTGSSSGFTGDPTKQYGGWH